ncbi:Hypothetical predicted protein [Lecanosticta acicola]|uniref:Uncharacterized protein n=1 Tax=Lecanosticta acicola TaxID=111012 RepID=A0AAI8Z965_9PEZI|nr:Hypothetical predicted protein [Lecanosticta acicola]
MARTTAQTTSDTPAAASSAAHPKGVTKRRSTRINSKVSSRLAASASSNSYLQSMANEAAEVVAGAASSSCKGKGKGKVVEQPPSAEDDDWDMLEDIVNETPPANAVCPIIDKDTKPFPIMELPTEIRLEIYRACLTRPYNILLSKREQPPQPEPETEADKCSLTLSDSQSDADDTDEDASVRVSTRTRQQRASTFHSHNATRSPLTHAPRGLLSRGTRPIRLLSSRSAPGSSSGNTGNNNNNSAQSWQPQANNGVVFRPATSRPARRNVGNTRSVMVPPVNEPPRLQTEDPLLVNILRASKEIYKEARSVLYSENLFTLDLNTAMRTLACLHQRSRRQIKHVELEIPTYNEILERFQETVRLSLRYCSGLKKFVIDMPFTLPGADGSGTTGNTTVYANGFDILRWLPQECDVILTGNTCVEIDTVVNKHLQLAKTLDKVSRANFQYCNVHQYWGGLGVAEAAE